LSKPANAAESPPGAQKQLSDFMEKYFDSMNMPSRAQMAGLGEQAEDRGRAETDQGVAGTAAEAAASSCCRSQSPKPRTKRAPSREQK
jgi:hypothetical protein